MSSLVLEAGVGGIHDSTNFFTEEELELAVITSISLDHTALLGDTLTEIATNKAGVLGQCQGRDAVDATC